MMKKEIKEKPKKKNKFPEYGFITACSKYYSMRRLLLWEIQREQLKIHL